MISKGYNKTSYGLKLRIMDKIISINGWGIFSYEWALNFSILTKIGSYWVLYCSLENSCYFINAELRTSALCKRLLYRPIKELCMLDAAFFTTRGKALAINLRWCGLHNDLYTKHSLLICNSYEPLFGSGGLVTLQLSLGYEPNQLLFLFPAIIRLPPPTRNH